MSPRCSLDGFSSKGTVVEDDESFIRCALELNIRVTGATGARKDMPRMKGAATLEANRRIDMITFDKRLDRLWLDHPLRYIT